MRIAIIGSGIAGLSAAWLLNRRHQVTLYERNDYFGGHTNTRTIETDAGPVAVDTGFIVFNDWTYPEFIKLLDELGEGGISDAVFVLLYLFGAGSEPACVESADAGIEASGVSCP